MLVVWQKNMSFPGNIPFHVVSVRQLAAEGQSATMASDTEVHKKHRGGTELYHEEKWHPLTFIGAC